MSFTVRENANLTQKEMAEPNFKFQTVTFCFGNTFCFCFFSDFFYVLLQQEFVVQIQCSHVDALRSDEIK